MLKQVNLVLRASALSNRIFWKRDKKGQIVAVFSSFSFGCLSLPKVKLAKDLVIQSREC